AGRKMTTRPGTSANSRPPSAKWTPVHGKYCSATVAPVAAVVPSGYARAILALARPTLPGFRHTAEPSAHGGRVRLLRAPQLAVSRLVSGSGTARRRAELPSELVPTPRDRRS